MRLAVTKRTLLFAAAVLALLAAACASPTEGTVDFGEGRRFVPTIADTLDDVGLMPSVALDGEGVPFVVYFGFPQELEEGDIPVTRPVSAPFVPSVLMASYNEGIFTKGAVAMVEAAPQGVSIPFGPAQQKDLKSITPDNVNGTAIAVDESGGLHVAYVTDSGLYYATGAPGASFEVQLVHPVSPKAGQAGPVGPPAIALDGDGNPWIAYGLDQGGRSSIEVATKAGDRFVTRSVVPPTRRACIDCPQLPTPGDLHLGIGVTADGPMVTYTGGGGPVALLIGENELVNLQQIEAGGGGFGLSMAVDGDGTPSVSYLTDEGAVHVATMNGRRWSRTVAAELGPSTDPVGEAGLVTGLAVDDEGVRTVAYVDVASDSVAASSDAEGEFAPLDVTGTIGGRYPSIAMSGDGQTLFLTWYDAVNGDLGLGTFAETNELAVARPSPTTEVTAAPAPTTDGGTNEKPSSDLAVAAPPGAAATGFDTTSLVAIADEDFTVEFDNQDPQVQHNWALYEDPSAAKDLAVGEVITGPAQDSIEDGPLPKGEYFYRCDIHPAQMTGTLVVE